MKRTIEAKEKGEEISAPEDAEPEVINLMDALRAQRGRRSGSEIATRTKRSATPQIGGSEAKSVDRSAPPGLAFYLSRAIRFRRVLVSVPLPIRIV